MKVLGVSGSPIPNSNTDRAVKAILDATGLEAEFIKLSDYKFSGCMHCLKCVHSNKCAITDDDGPMLIEKARGSECNCDRGMDALLIIGFSDKVIH